MDQLCRWMNTERKLTASSARVQKKTGCFPLFFSYYVSDGVINGVFHFVITITVAAGHARIRVVRLNFRPVRWPTFIPPVKRTSVTAGVIFEVEWPAGRADFGGRATGKWSCTRYQFPLDRQRAINIKRVLSFPFKYVDVS